MVESLQNMIFQKNLNARSGSRTTDDLENIFVLDGL